MNAINNPTGYSISGTRFDTTNIENPFYETTSLRMSLIEQLKNNHLIVEDVNNPDPTFQVNTPQKEHPEAPVEGSKETPC